MTSSDDTPVQTPSALLKLGLESCPCCDRRGVTIGGWQCFYCQGARVVLHERAAEWRKAHPHDYDKLPDTEPEQ